MVCCRRLVGEDDPLAQSILAREEKALQAMPDNLASPLTAVSGSHLIGGRSGSIAGVILQRAKPHRLPATTLNTLDLPETIFNWWMNSARQAKGWS